ncbi:MAG: Csu type fimbrial protein [Vreelandella alkaliphila]|uniref:Csu type fimbrial protein n=1 Tax=Halomonadaceae TaxID=28256 RepID=UPI0018683BE8|nr:spore coat protein U domain-containing protein [Halomonas sp. FME65]
MRLLNVSRTASLGTLAATLFVASSLAQAQSVTGTIDASITLEAACSVGGTEGTGVDFGSLAFGSHSALFDQVNAEIAGGNGITILCSPGVTPTFTLLEGANDGQAAPAIHAMENTPDGNTFVGYTLYTNASRTDPLALSGTIDLDPFTDDTTQSIALYGRAFGNPGNLPAGTYEDILQVQLTW